MGLVSALSSACSLLLRLHTAPTTKINMFHEKTQSKKSANHWLLLVKLNYSERTVLMKGDQDNDTTHMSRPLLMEGGGVAKDSAEAGGLDGVVVEGTGRLEDEDVVLSSVLWSGGVRGGVGKPVEDGGEEEEGSLTALLRDGFLSCTCCFCCTASSCLRSDTHKRTPTYNEAQLQTSNRHFVTLF